MKKILFCGVFILCFFFTSQLVAFQERSAPNISNSALSELDLNELELLFLEFREVRIKVLTAYIAGTEFIPCHITKEILTEEVLIFLLEEMLRNPESSFQTLMRGAVVFSTIEDLVGKFSFAGKIDLIRGKLHIDELATILKY